MVSMRPLSILKYEYYFLNGLVLTRGGANRHVQGIVESSPHLLTGPVMDSILQVYARHGFEFAALEVRLFHRNHFSFTYHAAPFPDSFTTGTRQIGRAHV